MSAEVASHDLHELAHTMNEQCSGLVAIGSSVVDSSIENAMGSFGKLNEVMRLADEMKEFPEDVKRSVWGMLLGQHARYETARKVALMQVLMIYTTTYPASASYTMLLGLGMLPRVRPRLLVLPTNIVLQ